MAPRRVCAAILAAVLAAAGLEAQSIQFSTVPNPVAGALEPDADAAAAQSLRVRCRRLATSYFVTFSAGQSGSFAERIAGSAGSSLSYQLYDDASRRNVLKDLSANPSSAEVLTGTFARTNNWSYQDCSFTLFVPRGQLPVPGVYTDTITVELYRGTPASPGAREARSSFVVSITVTSSLDVSMVATGRAFDKASSAQLFDFGALAPGAIRSADVVARSNTAYSLAVVSLNAGVLRPADASDPSSVPYRLSAGGMEIDLSAGTPQPVVSAAPPTSFAGARSAVTVQIGDYGWATEGSYSDVLTFQVTAN